MRKVVNGLTYDTDKATLIYTDNIKKRFYYMTKKRNFFVVYKNNELYPKTEDDMKMILGQNDYDTYVEIFGEPEEA